MTDEIKIENEVTVEEPIPEAITAKPLKTGIVQNCNRLNLRKEPSKKSDILCVIRKATELMIESDFIDGEWYRVYTSAGIGGYCMKEFIKIM